MSQRTYSSTESEDMPAKKNTIGISSKALRLKAEEKLSKNAESLDNLSEMEMKHLFHELNVHQIELEMQNDELKNARQQLEETVNKYSDLFNFAPVAYIILDHEGKIHESNATACQLLESEKGKLVNSKFQFLIDDNFKDIFFKYFKKVFATTEKQELELKLISNNGKGFDAKLICSPHILIKGSTKTCKMAIIDISEQKEAAKIINTSLQTKDRLKVILATQEQERKRIAEALHNGVGQILYAIKIKVDQMLKERKVKEESSDITALIKEAIDDLKNISYELVPTILEDFGLDAVVQKLCKKLGHADIQYDYTIYGYDKRLSLQVELSLFRIIQELINNIIKHSQANKAGIYLTIGENIMIRVEDNGIGFEEFETLEQIDSSGLRNIKYRIQLLNGVWEVKSEKNKGSQIFIKIPRKPKL